MMEYLKYEKYENLASDIVWKNIEEKYQYDDNVENKIALEELKTLICIHFILQDIDYTNDGRNTWLAFIFIVLLVILIKIW